MPNAVHRQSHEAETAVPPLAIGWYRTTVFLRRFGISQACFAGGDLLHAPWPVATGLSLRAVVAELVDAQR